jgi:hypothetical protein
MNIILLLIGFLNFQLARSACCTPESQQSWKIIQQATSQFCSIAVATLPPGDPVAVFAACSLLIDEDAIAIAIGSFLTAAPEAAIGAAVGNIICATIATGALLTEGGFCDKITEQIGCDTSCPPDTSGISGISCGSPPLDACTSSFCQHLCADYQNGDGVASCGTLPSCLQTDTTPWAKELSSRCNISGSSGTYFEGEYNGVCCCNSPSTPPPNNTTSPPPTNNTTSNQECNNATIPLVSTSSGPGGCILCLLNGAFQEAILTYNALNSPSVTDFFFPAKVLVKYFCNASVASIEPFTDLCSRACQYPCEQYSAAAWIQQNGMTVEGTFSNDFCGDICTSFATTGDCPIPQSQFNSFCCGTCPNGFSEECEFPDNPAFANMTV